MGDAYNDVCLCSDVRQDIPPGKKYWRYAKHLQLSSLRFQVFQQIQLFLPGKLDPEFVSPVAIARLRSVKDWVIGIVNEPDVSRIEFG